ncbi:MAG: Glutamyl-tRNA reductase [Marinobacterium sp. xm-d-530]|jgi:glutamyl-tRNA reductase|nr:MAG: Glutamyl-tRNA reductase [Marinobacterium sp. xm-d-530]
MSLLALGINHKTAPVEIRERVSFAPESLVDAVKQACEEAALEEVAILSTCNRTELYCRLEGDGSDQLLNWLANYHQVDKSQLSGCIYEHWDLGAARHMMRVAAGLDSLVLGEPQILGQLKDSFSVSQEAGRAHAELGRLFRQTFSVAKQVRTETSIGQNPVSVAYASVSLAQHIFADLADSRALLIGAGETIELVARHLKNAGIKSITIANRTLSRALALADEVDGKAVEFASIPDELPNADIVITSTASQLPILGKGSVERALKVRRHRPMFMVDIAVPRDIEAEVGELEDVYLYTVDDLTEVIEENQRSRQEAAQEAEAIIEQGAELFMRQLRELDAVDTLTSLRQQQMRIADEELEKALSQLQNGKSPEEVLKRLANGLTNKFLHEPSVQLRKASAEGRDDLQRSVQELFQLNPQSKD